MSRAVSLSGYATHSSRKGFLETLLKFDALRRQRNALSRLDETALKDVGLTREQALTEAGRPVWDSPQHWKK
ncbi:MAG: DUF1127 domain-containing protein [Rhodobacteraceae bacterium]|nr:DUF1127 domain-containing protein [Paracoccaceae bacterium]